MTRLSLLLALLLLAPTARAADLDELIAKALDASPALEGARARSRAAAARLDSSRADYRPTLDLTERWSLTDNPPAAFASILNQGGLTPAVQANLNDPEAVGDWTTAVTLQYLLTDFGGRGARKRAAEASVERSELMERVARREVVHAVRSAWYDLLEAEASVRTWGDTLELLAADEASVRARHDEGEALVSDVLAVQARSGEVREQAMNAETAAAIARARLAQLIGQDLPALTSDRWDLGRPLQPLPVEQVVLDMLSRHPEVAALEAAARAASAGIEAARASRRPRLVASAGWEWHGDSESFGLERDSSLLALLLQVPVYDGGRARAATAEAVARHEEILAARREAVLGLEFAARVAHRRLTDALARVEIADDAVRSAQEAHRVVRERHAEGLERITDLLESERRMTAARERGVHARASAWKAAAMLERVAGRKQP